MRTEEIINALAALGSELKTFNENDEQILNEAYLKNNWFTFENVRLALLNISTEFLDKEKLTHFFNSYKIAPHHSPKRIGLVMAGNLPLVGFQDWLCVVLSGNIAVYKLSSKDDVLFPWLMHKLFTIESAFKELSVQAEQLKSIDAVIATGSNNSSRYFEYYFSKYPHIIRKNRSSVAVLTGKETDEELELLADDIFSYFGLGCRNVSKLLVPEGYNFENIFPRFDKYKELFNHHKYRNNYDYNRTILLMNQTPHLANELVIITENKAISSPLATIHFEYYSSQDDLNNKFIEQHEQIQCVIGKDYIPFGTSQSPTLTDYADNIDVMSFLISL